MPEPVEAAGSTTTRGSDFLHLDASSAPARGLTRWLTDAVRTALRTGRLAPGTRLPATRTLARDLGVARGVVVEAYQRLGDEGLISARTGLGTVVAHLGTTPSSPPEVPDVRTGLVAPLRLPTPRSLDEVELDLSPGLPDISAFPRAAWLRAERAALAEATAADLGYGDPRGSARLRQELSAWLNRMRGVRADPDDVIVVAGVAQSLALLAQTLRARGTTRIAVEDPGSRGAREEQRHWGLEPVGVPIDDQGLDVDELVRSGATAVLVTPAHQFPTGVVLAPARRRALLDWAADGGLVVEDDYDAEHRYDRAPVPALQPTAPQHVAHTGSTSKTLAPGMRLGWLVPPRHLHADLVEAKHASDLGSPALPQLVLARLLAGGGYDSHLRLVRGRQRVRRDAVLAALRTHLPRVRVEGVAAGLHLLVTFPDAPVTTSDADLATEVRRAGVLVHPLSWHRVRPGPPGLVLGYAAHPPDRLGEAVRRLAGVVVRSGAAGAPG